MIQERFLHLSNTISRYFYQILCALVEMLLHYMKLLNKNYQTNIQIQDNLKYALYFQDYFGILNQTHINIHILYKKCTFYQNYISILLQNIFTIIIFDLCYYYILPKKERLVYDSRVLIDIVVNHRFSVPKDKYFFTNTGYCNSDYAMISY